VLKAELSRIADLERECGERLLRHIYFSLRRLYLSCATLCFFMCIFVFEIKGSNVAMRRHSLFLAVFPSHAFALEFPRDFKDLLDGDCDRDAPLPPIDRLDCPSSLLANSVGAVLYGFP